MEENNNYPQYQWDPRRYDSHLSLFGRKVLDNLINKWVEDRNRTRARSTSSCQPRMPPPYRPKSQAKKVLTFSSKESRPVQLPLPSPLPSPIACVDIPNANDDDDQPFHLDAVHKLLLPVPTANELFKTVASIENNRTKDAPNKTTNTLKAINNLSNCDEVDATNYQLMNPVIDVNEERPSIDRADDKEYAINPNCDTPSDGDLGNGPQVNWDNMFDTELLPVATNAKLMIHQNAITHMTHETLNVAHRKDTNCNNKKVKKPKIKETKQTDAIKPKHKVQPKVTEVLPKKVKKINESEKPKCVFRKEKYTHTVQNWLANVDPNNPVEMEEFTEPNSDGMTVIERNTISGIREMKESNIIIEKVTHSPKKKKVQAQLANKDGKMKFGKPKDITETKITYNKPEYDKSDHPKEKKLKLKFVAPIKCQVPDKEVVYNVIPVDSASITDLTKTLVSIQDKDITIVLIYSNGFSQLNQHHTEGSCEPDALIVDIEGQFYFFKGVHQGFKIALESLLENNRIICFEGKSLLIYIKSNFSFEFKDLTMIDTKIGGSLLDPDSPPDTFSDLQKLLSHGPQPQPQHATAAGCALQKAARHAAALGECALRLTVRLKEDGLWTVFAEVEMKLVPIIAEMERRGVAVDLPKLKSMEDILLSKMKGIEQECYKTAGKPFQINSTAQVRSILYEELQLDAKCNVKIRETLCLGAKSTSEAMLRSLASEHPLPRLILQYRHLHKVHATFLAGIAQHVDEGIVRPTWVQTAAATGRIASNNPNLQAIPKTPFSLLLFPNQNNPGKESFSLNIRSVYCARAGYTLLAADFRHVECRVFAHCAADRALLAALHAPGDLFHTLARIWLQKGAGEAVSPAERERTKRLVYAALYGAGAARLADLLGATYHHTLDMIAAFNRTFPSLKSFGRSVVSRCSERDARLHTLRGRSRRFPHITAADAQRRAHAERQAVNFVIQGSAADLCKTAMVVTAAALRAHRPPLDAALLLQIHDELVWELRDEHLSAAAAVIKQTMEGCGHHCGMPLTLPVALHAGRTWGDLAEYTATTTPR